MSAHQFVVQMVTIMVINGTSGAYKKLNMENVWICNWAMNGVALYGNDMEFQIAYFVLWVNFELIQFQ